MLMHLQAILVMIITLSEFIHSNINTMPLEQPSYAPPASQEWTFSDQMVPLGGKVEFGDLVGLSRILAWQWFLWMHQTVWIKVMSVMIRTSSVLKNLGRWGNWKKVKDIFLQ